MHDRFRLCTAIEAKINLHRAKARLDTYQSLLLPADSSPICVTPDVCFRYSELGYGSSNVHRGAYAFRKHYYPHVCDLPESGEEHDCAIFIDQMNEVKTWVRNLPKRTSESFWLQTSTDKFYPDFVCLLNDGRYLVVEYKGGRDLDSPDSIEKRVLGEVWEKRSNGLCLFVMPTAYNLESIRTQVAPKP